MCVVWCVLRFSFCVFYLRTLSAVFLTQPCPPLLLALLPVPSVLALLNFLRWLCEGQYEPAQCLMLGQEVDKNSSVNLLSATTKLLQALVQGSSRGGGHSSGSSEASMLIMSGCCHLLLEAVNGPRPQNQVCVASLAFLSPVVISSVVISPVVISSVVISSVVISSVVISSVVISSVV